MAVTREQKATQLKDLTEKFQNASSVIFAHYIGMTVADVSALRRKLKDSKAEMKVAKKTLMQLATKQAGLPEIAEESLDGAVACIFSFEDPLLGAQVAFGFAKDHPQVALLGGIYDGKLLSKAEAMALAKMPSKQVLLATFASMLRSPLSSFASMISSPLIGFARIANELAAKGGIPAKAA